MKVCKCGSDQFLEYFQGGYICRSCRRNTALSRITTHATIGSGQHYLSIRAQEDGNYVLSIGKVASVNALLVVPWSGSAAQTNVQGKLDELKIAIVPLVWEHYRYANSPSVDSMHQLTSNIVPALVSYIYFMANRADV